jgi:Tfp pilus assembly ATPase PilU
LYVDGKIAEEDALDRAQGTAEMQIKIEAHNKGRPIGQPEEAGKRGQEESVQQSRK